MKSLYQSRWTLLLLTAGAGIALSLATTRVLLRQGLDLDQARFELLVQTSLHALRPAWAGVETLLIQGVALAERTDFWIGDVSQDTALTSTTSFPGFHALYWYRNSTGNSSADRAVELVQQVDHTDPVERIYWQIADWRRSIVPELCGIWRTPGVANRSFPCPKQIPFHKAFNQARHLVIGGGESIESTPLPWRHENSSGDDRIYFTLPIYDRRLAGWMERYPPPDTASLDVVLWTFFLGFVALELNAEEWVASWQSNLLGQLNLTLLLDTSNALPDFSKTPPIGWPKIHPSELTFEVPWELDSGSARLRFQTTPQFFQRSDQRRALFALIFGLAVTGAFALFIDRQWLAQAKERQITSQLRIANNALHQAQTARQRLGRDLHDGAIQSLYALQLGLMNTLRQLRESPPLAARELVATRAGIDDVIAELRQFIQGEQEPHSQAGINLCEALRNFVGLQAAESRTHIDIRCNPDAETLLTGEQAVQLANIAREALSNSFRHAQPGLVSIELDYNEDSIVLEMRDDGIGFNLFDPSGKGQGLNNMKHRATEVDADFLITTAPGRGTRIRVTIPRSKCN